MKTKTLYGNDLKKLIEERLKVTTTENLEVKLVGTRTFLDEQDLSKKYKDKPKRLEDVLKNGKRFFCIFRRRS